MTDQSQNGRRDEVIDENLRRVYEEAVEEGIPDRFKSLLEQLKKQDHDQGQTK